MYSEMDFLVTTGYNRVLLDTMIGGLVEQSATNELR